MSGGRPGESGRGRVGEARGGGGERGIAGESGGEWGRAESGGERGRAGEGGCGGAVNAWHRPKNRNYITAF